MQSSNPGLKYDQDKPRVWLVPFEAVIEVAKVLTFGAKKYADNSWQTVDNGVERYTSALLRHLAAIQAGEVYDAESKLLHWSHVACNAMFLVWFAVKKELNNSTNTTT